MSGWTTLRGRTVALPMESVDTDQLVPARFMSTPRSAGYGDFLLHDMRHDEAGNPRPDFPLNRADAAGATILVARRNFGAGSSREAAVYALVDAGFKAVIAPSFGDIFSNNAVNNGLLPLRLDSDRVERLLDAPCEVTIDLEAGTLLTPHFEAAVPLDAVGRTKLINGWDDIDLTAANRDEIAAYAANRKATAPWTWPQEPAAH